MFARNFTVRFKPIKSNFVILPEAYKKLVSAACKSGCLLLSFSEPKTSQYKSIYVSWTNAMQATTPFELEEIGINSMVAESWGLRDGMTVSCSVIQNASPLKAISITLNGDDFQMAEMSAERIQNELLEQVAVVCRYQPFVIWLNKSISVKAVVDNLSPSFNYGRIQNDTEISINRKMNTNFMRPKSNTTNAENSSDAKMKRMSAIERSETTDLSNLRRNNSFIDSRRFMEKLDVPNGRSSNSRTESVHELTDKKPPLLSPRGSLKRFPDRETKKFEETIAENGKVNPLSVSSSLSDLKKAQDRKEAAAKEAKLSNSLSSSNIKRVQEKSNKFLESLSKTKSTDAFGPNVPLREDSPKSNQITPSASASSIPRVLSETETKQNHRLILEGLKKFLKNEVVKKLFMKVKIVDDDKKLKKFLQINELFVSKSSPIDCNQTYKVSKPQSNKEYHVRIKVNDEVSENSDALQMHPVLAKLLEVETNGEKVEVLKTSVSCNAIDNIELVPLVDITQGGLGHQIAKDLEEKFKKYVKVHARVLPIVLNQKQLFKLEDYIFTVKLSPPSTTFCCLDSDVLRESIIDVIRIGEPNEHAKMLQEEKKKRKPKPDANSNILKIDRHQNIIDDNSENLHPAHNSFKVLNSEQNNFVIAGAANSGKLSICNEIKKKLNLRSVNVSVFNCAQYKGRKVESIIRDIRGMLLSCLQTAPSVYVIFNIDSLSAQSHDEHQSQESEYVQKLTNSIRNVLEDFTNHYGRLVSILVTVSSLSGLNKILHKSFGYYLFRNVVKLPNLEADDRRELLKLLRNSSNMKIDKDVDWEKYVRTTEGYHIGDICQLVDRAIFFAIKDDFKTPCLNEEIMRKSLAISNQQCLQGIKTVDEDDTTDVSGKIPGMDNVIETLQEVMIWPTKFPKIFQNSPLRNQAGILLFGMPGTGKGFVVSQITKRWNLRLISIKGPELLAKYIGQSEENVRNLFEKAKSARPCVLFFDEFDSLAPRRGHDSTGVTDRVVNQLLVELDGVRSLEGVKVICVSTRPDLIDPALLRSGRIDRLVECQLPNAKDRLEILEWIAKSLILDPSIDLKDIAAKTENFSGADIKSLLITANMNAIEDELKKKDVKTLDDVEISKQHLENALVSTKPSLNRVDVERYQSLYNKFKNKKSVTAQTPKKVSLA